MTKHPPQEIYRHLCQRLRHRIELAELIANSDAPLWLKVETIALQGRKAIETISHMCLVATEHSLGELGIPKDAKKHWNAEIIFKRLKKRGISVLPSPSRMSKSHDPRFKAIFEGVPENRLTHDDLIEMYRSFHDGLHDTNPYRTIDSPSYFEALLPKLSEEIARLRRFAWIHFVGIKGEGFAVDLKNTHGVTAVVRLSKVAEVIASPP